MRVSFFALMGLLFLGALGGCQSPNLAQRVEAGAATLSSWPPEVQAAVRAGRIEVGFTPDQVRMAWGDPDHEGIEISAEAETERWVYLKNKPSIGIGFGVGSYGRGGGVGGSVGTTVGGGTDVVAVVHFKNGVVESFERASDRKR
jgi:hypothetical protein